MMRGGKENRNVCDAAIMIVCESEYLRCGRTCKVHEHERTCRIDDSDTAVFCGSKSTRQNQNTKHKRLRKKKGERVQ